MIDSLQGELIRLEPRVAVIRCGGIGFLCHITMNTARQLPAIGETVMLYTILNVREDAMELFGFADRSELSCFQQLTTISGVGPKAANAILSELSPERVAMAVAGGDFKTLTAAQGVGPKLAQRIVLEMKDKIKKLPVTAGFDGPVPGGVSAAGNAAEAVSALTVLGFSAGEASQAVAKLDSALSVEKLIREALKSLGKRS